MAATFNAMSTRIGMIITVQKDGKNTDKTISLSNIKNDITASVVSVVTDALGALLESPVTSVKIYKTSILAE